nr:HlyD family efflux transporter periplasmic adaptor subunit [Aquimixticola soesokkakensis]
MLERDMRGPGWVIRLCAVALFVFIGWSAIARVDEIVRGEGTMVSAEPPQIIQNLEGGIVEALLVQAGDTVEEGQVLARLRATQFQTQSDDLQDQIDALEVRKLRLEAELAGESSFEVPEALAARSPDILASERALLTARMADIASRASGARAVFDQADTERSLMNDMYEKRVISLLEATRARKAASDAQLKLDEIITSADLDRAQEYSKTLADLTSLKQGLKLASDQLVRTTIVAPMSGVVNNLNVTTIGGVLRPGEEIFQIIPGGDKVFVEARIKPEDIANVQIGQEATIKLSAYDYTIYGSLKGEVTFISADTFEDDRNPNIPPFYKVRSTVDLAHLTERQRDIAIRPGMRATVELHTGSKTFLSYLLKPLYKSREAFREP